MTVGAVVRVVEAAGDPVRTALPKIAAPTRAEKTRAFRNAIFLLRRTGPLPAGVCTTTWLAQNVPAEKVNALMKDAHTSPLGPLLASPQLGTPTELQRGSTSVHTYVSQWCGNSIGHGLPQGSFRSHRSWDIPRDDPIETRTHVQRVREPGYVMVRFQVARISAEKTREQVSYIVTSRRAGEWRYSQRERITTRWFELTTAPSRVFDLQKQHENPD